MQYLRNNSRINLNFLVEYIVASYNFTSMSYYTRQQVSAHNTLSDCWIIIDDTIFQLPSELIQKHPGSSLVILNKAGKDATYVFKSNLSHLKNAVNILEKYIIGVVKN